MANIAQVYIKGKMPFDLGEERDARQPVVDWLGTMNMPTFGLRVSYGAEEMRPNKYGGQTAFYDFVIEGKEALWYSSLKDLVNRLQRAGCEISEARMMDLEFDPSNMKWSSLL